MRLPIDITMIERLKSDRIQAALSGSPAVALARIIEFDAL